MKTKSKEQEATKAAPAKGENTAATPNPTPAEDAKNQEEIVDEFIESTRVAEHKPEELGFKDIVFLMSRPEAMAVLAERPEVVPEGFTGERIIAQVLTGFDRSVVKGNRVIGFALPCNIVAEAHDGVEVPCKMSAFDRRKLAEEVMVERDPARKRQKTKAAADAIAAAIAVQRAIPNRIFTAESHGRDDAAVVEIF